MIRVHPRSSAAVWLRLCLLGFLALLCAQALAASRPNIVLILIDDMGWGDFSCFGNRDASTPQVDRLAAEGIRFTQFYVNAPICSPSRCAVATGQYPQRWRITSYLSNRADNDRRGMAQWLDPKAPVLARILQQHGYATGHFGKWHLGGQRDVDDAPPIGEYGFDETLTNFEGMGAKLLPLTLKPGDTQPGRIWADAERLGGPATWMQRSEITGGFVNAALDFINRAVADGKPFYINLWPDDVHSPYWPPVAKWGDGSKRRLYLAVLEEMDRQFGRLFDHIRNTPALRDNTLVLVCSDNGPEAGAGSAGPFRGGKATLYEGGTRSPLVGGGPGLVAQDKAGTRNETSVFAAFDLPPSLLSVAGIAAPADVAFDGENVAPVLLGQSAASRTAPLFWRRPPDRKRAYGPGPLPDLSMREGNWKLLCEYDGTRPQLYDLAADTGESVNRAPEQPELVAQLSRKLLGWNKTLPPDTGPALAAGKPNVLFIAIDDQNDWIGHLRGHPMAKTPHLDSLAARGTTFLNAHCQSPLCNPSRTSLMLGLRPTTTRIYGLAPAFRTLPEWKDRVTLPQHFAAHGYRTAATGKIFHGGTDAGAGKANAADATGRAPEFHVTAPYGGVGSRPPKKLIPPTPMGNHPLMDWGVWPLDNDDTTKGDYQGASWTVEQIRTAPKDRPFFIAAGFFLPHVPCYATQKWFDLYPDDDSVLPRILEGDREDTPRFSWYLHWELPEPRLKWVKENNQWRNLVRSYLACTSFVDAQIGRLLAALEDSDQAGNTIVVVWGDNGWHLGEKGITGKNTLWDESTRVPLVFAGPGVRAGQRCAQPAELLDIYPTLIELAGLPPRQGLDGISLGPQLRDASAKRERPALTSHNQGNHGVRSERWRYIRYADGSEELYDMQTDPHAWHNLAAQPGHAAIIAEHRKWLPKVDRPPAPNSAHRILTYDAATDIAVWEGTPVKRADPIPE